MHGNYPKLVADNLVELVELNADSLKEKKRRSNRWYITHPLSAAHLATLLMGEAGIDDPDVGRKAISYIISHDFLDEACDNEDDQFGVARQIFIPEWTDQLNAAVLLSGSGRSDNIGRTLKLITIKKYGDPAHAIALLADAIDNMLDLDYFGGEGNIDADHILKKVPFALFASQQLADMVSGVSAQVEDLCYQQLDKFSVQQDWSPENHHNHLVAYMDHQQEYFDHYQAKNASGVNKDRGTIIDFFRLFGFAQPLPVRVAANLPDAQSYIRALPSP